MTGKSWTTLELAQIPSALAFAVVYIALGAASLSTAYVQANTATVWIPSGFAVGLLLSRGNVFWPSITLGSFVLNLAVNVANGTQATAADIAVAALIAGGNTGEALLGSWLTSRYANGTAFLFRPRSLTRFLLLAVPIPPLVSAAIGLLASQAGDLVVNANEIEVFFTWYVANVVGILIFAGLTIYLLTQNVRRPTIGEFSEILALGLCLAFAIQAVCGIYFSKSMAGWPKAYMLIPLLLWASFRFGGYGGLIAIAITTAGASIGTMNGFMVFPAETPSLALMYLQTYLAMLAIVTLTLTAALSEADTSRTDLEYRVEARTRAIEQLLSQSEAFTALVAHDLRSPVYGVRNTLKTVASAVEAARISPADLSQALRVMEETCTTLADRIASLLLAPPRIEPVRPLQRRVLAGMLFNIRKAHQLTLRDRNLRLDIAAEETIKVDRPAEIEHIVDTFVDNAIRHSPEGGIIKVSASEANGLLSIRVADQGPGLPAEHRAALMAGDQSPLDETTADEAAEPTSALASAEDSTRHPRGLGLFLAQKQAGWLGGRVTYEDAAPHGAVFTLRVPASPPDEGV